MPTDPDAPKRGPGRPRSQKHTKWPRALQVHMDDDLREKIEGAAQKEGVPTAQWVREACEQRLKGKKKGS